MKRKIVKCFISTIVASLLSVSQAFAITIPENYAGLFETHYMEIQRDTTEYQIGDVMTTRSMRYGILYYKVTDYGKVMICTQDGEILNYNQVQQYFNPNFVPKENTTTVTQDTTQTVQNNKTNLITEPAKEDPKTMQKSAPSEKSNLLSTGDPTLGRLIGDISRGNHPQAPYAESEIIVPRPFQSRFAPITKGNGNTSLKDIKGHWAESELKIFAEKGYIAGDVNGNYYPDTPVTYGELATIFCRLNPKPIRFDDIMEYDLINIFSHKDTNAWYYPSLLVADEAGLWGNNVKLSYEAGFMSNNRRPNTIYGQLDAEGAASRQYVALFLANMVESKESDNTVSLNYKDKSSINANSDSDILKAIKRLVNNDIISGYADNTFRPESLVTRAELVSMLTKILDTYQWDMDVISDNLYGNYKQFFWEQDEALMELVNEARIAGGVQPVVYNADLQAICEVKMIDKTINGYDSFGSAHISSFGTVDEMRLKFGIPNLVAENAAAGIATPQILGISVSEFSHEIWTDSKEHYENYMDKRHVYAGFSLGECYGYESFSTKK